MMRSIFALFVVLFFALAATAAAPPERQPADGPVLYYSGTGAKAVVDTIDLMGPRGAYPFRGDFETASPLPSGDGQLTDGWVSVDETVPPNHWHVDTYNNPGSGNAAWCGSPAIAACEGDVAGGYGNLWYDILEFRKTVPGAATVRVQGVLRYDTEPGYDYVTLQRRTAAQPYFEPVDEGQGLSWSGAGTTPVDYTFAWTAAERYAGTDIAIAFTFRSDGGWSDVDCSWPTEGAAIVDDLVVTMTSGSATVYAEDFEDGALGPDWVASPNDAGVGDYARVWARLCDADPCNGNISKQVGFLETDHSLWPSPNPDPCDIVNNIGTARGMSYRLDNAIYSPVMPLPDGANDGLTLAFDTYWDQVGDTYVPLTPVWNVRSTAGGDINAAPWVGRNAYFVKPSRYTRQVEPVGDLLVPGATAVQVMLGVAEFGWCYGCYVSDAGRSIPYFDNVSVKAYPSAGPRIVITETRMANDGFPASGALDLADLGANSVRFDMAANIAFDSHLRNDPGDSITIDATPRNGATLDAPVMHWTLARRNPLFDPYRTLPAGPVTGRVTRNSLGTVVANRWSFDLPDTGMLFPGDVLHYYFAATDHVAGDTRTTTAPADLAGFGDPEPLAWPGLYTVRCLPSLTAGGGQPAVLFWNDQGFRGGEDEWYGALRACVLFEGIDVDVYTTKAPGSGLGNGLGGRAKVAQIAGYTDLLYTSGDLGSPTLSNGDYSRDPGNDLALLNGWLALGGRDVLLTGDDLASSLTTSGAAGQGFLESTMGVIYADPDVKDNISGQTAPRVVKVSGNPVILVPANWLAYGGCPVPADFDAVTPAAGAIRLAQFTAPDGVSTPYPYAAATLKISGTNRAVSFTHDLMHVMGWDHPASGIPLRAWLLDGILSYFAVPRDIEPSAVPDALAPLAVVAHPNPFNPSITLRYTLARPGQVTMKVFDARGALVRTLLDGPVAGTVGTVLWDGADHRGEAVASGLYLVETRADGQVDVRKVTMIK